MTKHILMLGQSNAVGLGQGGYLGNQIDSRVQAWDNENSTVSRTAGTQYISPSLGNHPLNATASKFYQNMGVWFCSRLAKELREDINFMLVAKGGTGIEAYDNRETNPFLWNEVINNWGTVAGNPAADVLIHCGHEANRTDIYSTYKAKQDYVISELTTAGIIDGNTVIIITGLAEDTTDHKDFNDNVLRPYCNNTAGANYVETVGLAQWDASHFTGAALCELGFERIWQASGYDAASTTPDTLYAQVEDDLQVESLLDISGVGIANKDVTTPPVFNGDRGASNLLTAPMIAGGAVVESGVNENGEYIRFENGWQICTHGAMMERFNGSILFYDWTFPAGFLNAPYPSASADASNELGMSIAKWAGSFLNLKLVNNSLVKTRMYSNNLYTGGDEQVGVILTAIGRWK